MLVSSASVKFTAFCVDFIALLSAVFVTTRTALMLSESDSAYAVSYTHLDVYKRQEEYTLLATKLSEVEFDLGFWFKKSESVEAEVFVKLNDEGGDSTFDYFETKLINLK